MGFRFDRAFFRLVYPLVARPELKIGGDTFPVIDLSEEGVRFEYRHGPTPTIGTKFVGYLVLKTVDYLPIEGQIIRVARPHIGAKLTKGVPFAVMMEEQRYLQRRFVNR